MKRAIGLICIFVVEIAFGVVYYLKNIWNQIVAAIPYAETIAGWFRQILTFFKDWISFEAFSRLPNMAKNIIIIVALNLVFLILYLLIFGIIAAIQKRSRRKKLLKNTKKTFTLSDEEKAKFEWKLYEKKFPIRRLISLLIPILFTLICIVIRYDVQLCAAEDSFHEGYFTYYSSIRSYLGGFGAWIDGVSAKYIHLNNRIVNAVQVTWVEWVEIGVAFFVLCLIWWGFFSIFARPFRRHHAKKKARKAKNKYVARMELLEYKAWKKSVKEASVSAKSKEFYEEESSIVDAHAEVSPIAVTIDSSRDEDNEKLKENVSTAEKDYIDDIAAGVTDLGVIEEDTGELNEPLTVRETHFVGEEEVDIVLEEEPVIETIEEEDAYYNGAAEEEEAFERYQPEAATSLNVEDKIRKYNIDVIDESEQEIRRYHEDEAPAINEYEEKDILYTVNERYLKSLERLEESKSAPETEAMPVAEPSEIVEATKEAPASAEEPSSEPAAANPVERTPVEEAPSAAEKKKVIQPIRIVKEEIAVEIPAEKETAKPKVVEVINRKPNERKKPMKPLDVQNDRRKVVEYILSTNTVAVDHSIVALSPSEEQKSAEEAPKPVGPLHSVKQKPEQKKVKPIAPMKVGKKKK